MKRPVGEYLIEAMAALYNPKPPSDEERAEHARRVLQQRWRDQRKADRQGDVFEQAGEN